MAYYYIILPKDKSSYMKYSNYLKALQSFLNEWIKSIYESYDGLQY